MRHKLTLINAQNITLEKGGQCLSEYYINNKSPLHWKCAKFHEWNSALCDIKRDTWCPHCVRCFKLNIDIAKEIALKKGDICLSEKYINIYTPLYWQCAKNHKWQASLERIKNQNFWCPKCAGRSGIRLFLQIAKNIAQSRNGECLSDKYINIDSKLLWECNKGNAKLNIDIAKEIAHRKKGKCLSENYINIDSKLLWECNKGGDCISEKYINSITHLLWQCAKNHLWYANLDKVKNSDTWCPFCPWKREELCKNVVTKLLGSPSDIRKSDFLKTPDHPLGLEVDIYYLQYGFAIEVQSIQHERFHAFFHKDQEVFKKQLERDQLKKRTL
ncbi:hypothetical protein Glove_218g56 [Diversispora epigaea]|uniref:Zinc-ribbon domain-containing protein n=1 Tax=Diversispora epigaea TaxID=1348612 RepID=A0A397IGG5_9GLOM|nr:hypothetical protein Glove_218g56 [Diversispora epigaea]